MAAAEACVGADGTRGAGSFVDRPHRISAGGHDRARRKDGTETATGWVRIRVPDALRPLVPRVGGPEGGDARDGPGAGDIDADVYYPAEGRSVDLGESTEARDQSGQ